MPTFTWWIDEPLVMGCSNPSDEYLARLRVDGVSVAVSLLEESKQPPRYDKRSARDAGWSIYEIPIEEGRAPSLEQIRDFTARLEALPLETKVIVFCESGLGRTAFMGAIYWVQKGLSSRDAIARISEACSASDWVTAERRSTLEEYERLRGAAGTKRSRSPSS
jgi:protein-tyrosine phosphatase